MIHLARYVRGKYGKQLIPSGNVVFVVVTSKQQAPPGYVKIAVKKLEGMQRKLWYTVWLAQKVKQRNRGLSVQLPVAGTQ